MDSVLQGLEFCYVYLDDMLIASPNAQVHTQHLEMVFKRLRVAGLLLK
jgi:hypothetical protein